MVSSTDSSATVPLTADVTTANIPDNQVYRGITSSSSFNLSSETIKKIHFMVADPGYDDQSLYDLSTNMGFRFVCPVRRYKNTSEERLKLVELYESALGKVIYSKRAISIEPLIEHMKPCLSDKSSTPRGCDKVRSIVLLSVLLYQLLVYSNCKVKSKKDNPRRTVKSMIGC